MKMPKREMIKMIEERISRETEFIKAKEFDTNPQVKDMVIEAVVAVSVLESLLMAEKFNNGCYFE